MQLTNEPAQRFTNIMYSMPGHWAKQQIDQLIGSHDERPLATTQRRVAWEDESLRVEYNLVRNVATLEDHSAVRIVPARMPYYGAVVVPLSPDEHLHFVGRYRYAVDQWSIELPRFDFESGDAGWKDSATADLLRITGLVATGMRLLGAVQIDPALMSTSTIVVLAEGCRFANARRHSQLTKTIDPCGSDAEDDPLIAGTLSLPLAELLELIQRGEIVCGVTLAALSLYRARLR